MRQPPNMRLNRASTHAFSPQDVSCTNSATSTNGADNVNDERIIAARRTCGKNRVTSQDLDSLYERFCNALWEAGTKLRRRELFRYIA